MGYVTGRFIGENIRTILDLLEITEKQIDPGVFINFEKEFDTVN